MKPLNKNIKYLIKVFLVFFIARYCIDAYLRSTGDVVIREKSFDNKYIAEIIRVRSEIFTGNGIYLVKIFDSSGNIVVATSKTNTTMDTPFWVCSNDKCDGLMWSTQDDFYIKVPPSWLDRLIAKIP